MDEKFEKMLLMWKEINDVIEQDLSLYDRNEFNRILKILKVDTWFIIVFVFKNEIILTSNFENLNLSKLDKDHDLLKLYKEFIGDSKIKNIDFNIFQLLIRKILVIGFSKNNLHNDNDFKPFFEKYKTNLFLLDERLKETENAPKIIMPSFTKFKFEKNYGKSCTNFLMELKKLKKIDKNTSIDNFEIIFSIKKLNNKFQKINWTASIYQLKNLIRLMMHKQIIKNDINYLDTIIDCFKLKNEEITKQKLDARGESHTIEYQKDLLIKTFELKTP